MMIEDIIYYERHLWFTHVFEIEAHSPSVAICPTVIATGLPELESKPALLPKYQMLPYFGGKPTFDITSLNSVYLPSDTNFIL